MRYLKIKIVLLFALILGIPSVAKEGGDDDGGEEGETTAVVSSGYTSQRSEDGINASLGYTNNLTKNLLFRFDVGLSNRFNTTENREIESHLVGLSSKYDPPSPWKLDVRYNYNRSYNYRPEEINQDEYLAYTRSHSLGSSLSYAFTESVRTYLDVNLSKSEMESKVAGESNPDTDSNQNSIDSLVEYDITPSTAVNVRYSGGIDSTEYSGSSERVADPPPPPKKGRTQRHSVYGSIVSNNSITDNFNLDMSLNVNDATKRDELLPGLDSDALSGTASNAISYDLASKVSLSNRVNLSRKLFTYHNKKEYRDEFSKNIYDTDDTTLLNASELTIQPSGSTSVSVAYDINFEKRYRYIDRIRGLMPTEVSDPKAAGNIYEDIEQKLVSKVNTAIGEDLTFHLTYYYSSSHPDYVMIPAKNSLIVIDNLDSNLGYDITKKVRSDVNTILNFTRVNYDDAERAIDDIRQYSISLGNDFTYKPSLDTTMSLGFLVRKNSNDYVNNVDKSYENVDRDLTASISHEFGRLADVSVGSTISYDYTNFLGNALSNSRTDTFELNPSVYSEFSETLSSTINFDFNRITKWNPKGDAIESWKQTYDYTTNLSVIYSPFDKFTINFSMGTGHNYRLEHKTFRVKKSEDDDYYNVSLNASYEW